MTTQSKKIITASMVIPKSPKVTDKNAAPESFAAALAKQKSPRQRGNKEAPADCSDTGDTPGYWVVAQGTEQQPSKLWVGGSNPPRPIRPVLEEKLKRTRVGRALETHNSGNENSSSFGSRRNAVQFDSGRSF